MNKKRNEVVHNSALPFLYRDKWELSVEEEVDIDPDVAFPPSLFVVNVMLLLLLGTVLLSGEG